MSFLRTGLLLVLVVASAWVCSGCAGGRPGGGLAVEDAPTPAGTRGLQLYTLRVGDKLDISPRTVETHRERVMGKLRIRTVAGLTRFVVENGLTDEG